LVGGCDGAVHGGKPEFAGASPDELPGRVGGEQVHQRGWSPVLGHRIVQPACCSPARRGFYTIGDSGHDDPDDRRSAAGGRGQPGRLRSCTANRPHRASTSWSTWDRLRDQGGGSRSTPRANSDGRTELIGPHPRRATSGPGVQAATDSDHVVRPGRCWAARPNSPMVRVSMAPQPEQPVGDRGHRPAGARVFLTGLRAPAGARTWTAWDPVLLRRAICAPPTAVANAGRPHRGCRRRRRGAALARIAGFPPPTTTGPRFTRLDGFRHGPPLPRPRNGNGRVGR